ncbi:hypothetical protein [Saccharothrix yanglingensis]|uniref:hypothetical protein n=1 Tax=Saccharothrix yanglingensis TaxID=659496 RepID=UPI0027D2FD85|nr:hypothetical protein [Saccharothrix yanglingensis]
MHRHDAHRARAVRSRLGLVHVGDARAHLLRGGGLFRITHDHTVVRSLIEEGRLTGERRSPTRGGRCSCAP